MMVLLLLAALPVARRRQRDVAEFKGYPQRVRLGQLQTTLRTAHPMPALELSECGHVHADECLLPGVVLQIAQHSAVETRAALVWLLNGFLKLNRPFQAQAQHGGDLFHDQSQIMGTDVLACPGYRRKGAAVAGSVAEVVSDLLGDGSRQGKTITLAGSLRDQDLPQGRRQPDIVVSRLVLELGPEFLRVSMGLPSM